MLEEYGSNGVTSYIYGSDLISQNRNGVKSFYVYDGLGSTRALTDASGTVTDTYNYDAYGNLSSSTGSTANSYLYAGEQFDKNLGDYYLRDRYYSTDIGRFTQRDRFDGDMNNPLSLNRYGYTHGNPVNAIDPSGMFLTVQEAQVTQVGLAELIKQYAVAFVSTTARVTFQVATALARTYIQAGEIPKNLGIPVLVYGGDLPETSRHVFRAITFSGYTQGNESGDLLRSEFISPVLTYIRPEDNSNKRGWYDYRKPCKDRPSGYVCDEYPYNSTIEGGKENYENGVVSIYPVINTEQTRGSRNQAQALGKFYKKSGVEGFPGSPLAKFANFSNPFNDKTSWYSRDGKGPFYFW